MKSDLRPVIDSRTPRRHRATLFAATSAVALLAAGCGGGGGHVTPTPVVNSQALTEQARTQLNTLIAAGASSGSTGAGNGSGGLDSATLSSVRSQFDAAYAADKTNTQAAFGLAVTDLALHAQAVADAADASAGRAQSARRAQATKVSSSILAVIARPVVLWNLTGVRGLTGTRSLAALATLPLARSRQATSAGLESALNDLLTALNRDIPLITLAANDGSFAFPMSGIDGTAETVTVDQADARAFEVALYGGRAALDVALAYNIDPGTFAFDTQFGDQYPAIVGGGGSPIPPSAYLPPAPFGTLQSNGKTLFASAKADLGTAATVLGSDIPLLQARTGTTTHLIPSDDLTSEDYSQLQLGLVAAQYALNHSFPSGGVTYNLSAWFANPPASLTALEPTYHGDSGVYSATVADYPDKTFGGLISGLPDSAYTPHVDADGTYADLAAEGLATPLKAAIPTNLPGL